MPDSPVPESKPRPAARKAVPLRPRSVHKPSLKQRLANPMRWLHVYSSMFGLLALLFFSVTGFTLNHQDWAFGGVSKEESNQGTLPREWLGPAEQEVAKLEIVEYLRREHKVRGLVEDFATDEAEGTISFKGPAYSADVFFDRETGAYEVTQFSAGFTAWMNDLHKGRHTGKAWSLVVDLSAVLLFIVSVTGLALLLYIKRRRRNGLFTALGGLAILVVIVWLCVP